MLGSVGEPINPEAWLWYYRLIGEERCSIVDTFWQTETGGHVLTPLPGATPMKPGSAVSFFTVSKFPWKIELRKGKAIMVENQAWDSNSSTNPELRTSFDCFFSKHPRVKNTTLKSEKILKHNKFLFSSQNHWWPLLSILLKRTQIARKKVFYSNAR